MALNKERAAEESRGIVRWLRPEYQNPQCVQQSGIDVKGEGEGDESQGSQDLLPWPPSLAEQAQAVQRALQVTERPVTAEELHNYFVPVRKPLLTRHVQQIESLLQTLYKLGLVRKTEREAYVK